jgi:hypothetical protein
MPLASSPAAIPSPAPLASPPPSPANAPTISAAAFAAQAPTGTIQRKIDWPTPPLPHVYNNFRIAIARFHAGHPDNLAVLTDSDFVKGDWRGDGTTELFWYKFHLDRQGKGTLYFAEPVYHMLDFMGSGAEQVIALDNSRGILEVYGSRSAQRGAAQRGVDYRRQIANHTHY